MEELPSHIMVEILSRLPVKTIIHCKRVCKNWRNLVMDSHFADIHLSRSPTGLIIHHKSITYPEINYKPGVLKWVEIEDELDRHRLHHDPVMSLDLSLASLIRTPVMSQVGSVNGLACLWEGDIRSDDTFICNPITREYMILPRPKYYRDLYAWIVYGFGVGLQTKEYKVIRIFQGDIPPDPDKTSRPSILEAEIYTLGTGQWRSLGHVPYWLSGFHRLHGPFLNGQVHWRILDKDCPEEICAFDLDKETFQLFPSPPCEKREIFIPSLEILKGCLCLSRTFDSEFVVWVMKEYGIKKSWHKLVVVIKPSIGSSLDVLWEPIYVVEGLKDGMILMMYYDNKLLEYCPQTKTIQDTGIFDRYLDGMTYRPSFIRLQRFESERVYNLF